MNRIIVCPLYLQLSERKDAKKYHLNLNNYRNWHFQVSNNLKKKFKETIGHNLEGFKFNGKVGLEFVVYYPDKRKRDRANITSILEKFICDAMVELKALPDDNDDFIEYSLHRTGGIDKINPRCEVTIIDLSISVP